MGAAMAMASGAGSRLTRNRAAPESATTTAIVLIRRQVAKVLRSAIRPIIKMEGIASVPMTSSVVFNSCRPTVRGSAARRTAGPMGRERLWPKTTTNLLERAVAGPLQPHVRRRNLRG